MVVLNCDEKLDVFLEISQAITGGDPNDVLNSVIYDLGKKLGYTLPAVFLFNDDRSKLLIKKIGVKPQSLKALKKYFPGEIKDMAIDVSEQQNLLVKAVVQNDIVTSRDLHEFARPFLTKKHSSMLQDHIGAKLVAAVPLMIKGQTVGVLAAFLEKEEMGETEELLLKNLAGQIAVAIYHASLFSKINRQVEQLETDKKNAEALHDISVLLSSNLAKSRYLQALLDALPEKFSHSNIFGAAIFLEDASKTSVRFFAETNNAQTKTIFSDNKLHWNEDQQGIQTSEVLRQVVFEKDMRLFMRLVDAFPDILKGSRAKKINKIEENYAYIAAPIVHGHTVMGVIILCFSQSPLPVDKRFEEVLLTFVNHVSDALEHISLYEKLQDQYARSQRQREALIVANEQLKTLDQAKSDFISIASHQLRTPLTVIKGYLSLLLEGTVGKCDAQALETVQKLSVSTDRLVDLVNDLLDISRIERGVMVVERESTDLDSLVKSVVEELLPEARRGRVEMTYHAPRRKLPEVMADRKKLREVIFNLIENSVKYTPHDGKVDVYLKKDKQNLLFMVKDTGLGLSPETIPRLFEKFSRGEGVSAIDTEGVGLGLFVAKRIIDAHNGEIWAESEGEGKGSAFYFTLPIPKN